MPYVKIYVRTVVQRTRNRLIVAGFFSPVAHVPCGATCYPLGMDLTTRRAASALVLCLLSVTTTAHDSVDKAAWLHEMLPSRPVQDARIVLGITVVAKEVAICDTAIHNNKLSRFVSPRDKEQWDAVKATFASSMVLLLSGLERYEES